MTEIKLLEGKSRIKPVFPTGISVFISDIARIAWRYENMSGNVEMWRDIQFELHLQQKKHNLTTLFDQTWKSQSPSFSVYFCY